MCIFKYQKARHSESWAELPWVWGWPGLYCEFQASVGYRVRVCPKQQQQKVKSLKRKRTEIAITYFRAPILKIRTGHINLVNIYVYICAENSQHSKLPSTEKPTCKAAPGWGTGKQIWGMFLLSFN